MSHLQDSQACLLSQTYFHYNKDWDSIDIDQLWRAFLCHRPISTTTRIETLEIVNHLSGNLRSQTYFHYNKDWDLPP